ncbi:hypothetical protein ACN08Y_10130 [Rothia sp. P5764]|uniref:hypothetical protein n=1 Tax=Rothia sp. P5764 TaxID=3402654 RepID=UPI003AD364B5
MSNQGFKQEYGTEHYLSTTGAAEYLGMTRQAFKKRNPPKPQVVVGDAPGWTRELLDAWDADFRANSPKPKPRVFKK